MEGFRSFRNDQDENIRGGLFKDYSSMNLIPLMKRLIPLGALLTVIPSAGAQENIDMNSFWYGWAMGATGTSCEFARLGKLSKDEAARFMQAAIKEMEKDAEVSQYISEVKKGYELYVETNQECR